MYVCGPTVYGPGHLGHGRTYVNFDLLRRTLIFNGFKVKYVMNITDVHDDMIKQAKKEGVSILELADKYIPLFKADLKALNILPADVYPRVTENIEGIIKMIKALIDRGYAYLAKDGSVYYRVNKFKNYGRLSGRRVGETKTGTRVETDKYEREQAADFTLWKAAKPGEPATVSWDSPWGKGPASPARLDSAERAGRPGWHIECSVMAKKHLGETIDIHAGAMDLKFPHHENEIAQSEAANGQKFVNYWLHAGLLEVEGKKMSKSLGNFIEIQEIKEKRFEPLALRYLFLTSHYRAKMNFTWAGLAAAQKALVKLRRYALEARAAKERSGIENDSRSRIGGIGGALVRLNDDLDIPGVLAWMWQKVKDKSLSYGMIKTLDQLLGLRLTKLKIKKPLQDSAGIEKLKINEKIKNLLEKREELRKAKKFKEADQIREKIRKIGYHLEDTKQGAKLSKI